MKTLSNIITTVLFASDGVERERVKNIIVKKHGPYVNLLGECDCPIKTIECIAEFRPDVLLLCMPTDSQGILFFIDALQKTDFMPHIMMANLAIGDSFFPSQQQVNISYNKSAQTHCFVNAVNKKYHRFETASIAYIKADGDTAVIHFLSGTPKTVLHSLGQLEKILPSFVRIGRFHLINPQNVTLINGVNRTCDFNNAVNGELLSIDLHQKQLSFLKNYFKINDFS